MHNPHFIRLKRIHADLVDSNATLEEDYKIMRGLYEGKSDTVAKMTTQVHEAELRASDAESEAKSLRMRLEMLAQQNARQTRIIEGLQMVAEKVPMYATTYNEHAARLHIDKFRNSSFDSASKVPDDEKR